MLVTRSVRLDDERNPTMGKRSMPLMRPSRASAALVVVVLVAAGCGDSRDPGKGADSGRPDGQAHVSSGMEHVHGLGVDTADGSLYAGSHYGVFRISDDGKAERIAGQVQDFMGFTVVGPGHFLASGHPGEGQNGPANVGLIESNDAGETWETISLSGEADFHALEAKHGRVYGWHAGQLMLSEDNGKSWQNKAQIPLADLALSPTEPDVLVATTEQGLAKSIDSGATFAPSANGPVLQLITWPTKDRLIGVAPDGAVHISVDGGRTWSARGTVSGQPHALTATADTIWVAMEGSIVSSNDDGKTFTTIYPQR